MKINLKKEYIIFSSLMLLSLVVVYSGFFRILIGLPYALFVPGYLMTVILFPKAEDLNGPARISISVGLSIIVVPLIGFLQNYLPWGIGLLPMMLSLTVFNAALMALGWFVRNRLPEEQRFALAVKVDWARLKEKPKPIRIITWALLATGLVTFAVLILIMASPKSSDKFTEFYITGQDGIAAGYPEQLKVGQEGAVKLTVVNNENQKTIYRVEVRMDEVLIRSINHISLDENGKWEETVSFTAKKSNEIAKVEFLLFRDGKDTAPYRQLKLWVKITS